MGTAMAFSVHGDTYTTDESLYLPTGYLYLTEQTMRVGFEHPPLVRDIAAIPLLFLNLRPASDFLNLPPGTNLSDAVWSFGEQFLFNQTKPVDVILWWARLPMILLTLLFGWCVFALTRRHWGTTAGFIALALFTTSPLILGHGRLVTTDVMTAFAAFLATYWFVRFLGSPTRKTALAAGVVLGIAELVKFSLLLLIPFFLLLVVVWAVARSAGWRSFWKGVRAILPKLLLIGLVCIVVVGAVYQLHIARYPAGQQADDIRTIITSTKWAPLAPEISSLATVPVLRPFAEYLTGVLWQYTRGSAFAYFEGQGSTTGFPLFFPVGYAIKEPLAFHILTLITILVGLGALTRKKVRETYTTVVAPWIRAHLFTAAAVLWVLFYWFVLIVPNSINTGVRYLIPTLPFVFLLIGAGVAQWLENGKVWRVIVVTALIAWQVIAVASVYPSFLAYFNELVGGPDGGYRYVVDTDLDWGQDARRLADWVGAQGIPTIQVASQVAVSYEGTPGLFSAAAFSSSFPYYLGNRYRELPPATPVLGWVAIPARALAWGQTEPGPRNGWSSDSYRWLGAYRPVTTIGHSIFVYYINDTAPGIAAQNAANVATAQRVADATPTPENFFNLGFVAIEAGDWDTALAATKEAIRENSSYAEAYNNLGFVYQSKGMDDSALAAYKTALALKPDFTRAKNNLDQLTAAMKKTP